jgi:hypothetical protein
LFLENFVHNLKRSSTAATEINHTLNNFVVTELLREAVVHQRSHCRRTEVTEWQSNHRYISWPTEVTSLKIRAHQRRKDIQIPLIGIVKADINQRSAYRRLHRLHRNAIFVFNVANIEITQRMDSIHNQM